MITVTAFKWVPPIAQGLVRDLRVRWALEEAGLPYRSRRVDFDEAATPAYHALQPFGQVPAIEEDGQTLFESGAIVLHIGERSEALLPADPAERTKAIAWLFAALNSVEIFVVPFAEVSLFSRDEDWAKARRPRVEELVRRRLGDLAARLGDRDYLEHRFTAGDLMMASVLRILRHCDMVASIGKLGAYLSRCEARPAFQRALAAQMGDFDKR